MAGESWEHADRISEKITALLNAEIAGRPDFSVVDLWVGQLLALASLMDTAWGTDQPQSFQVLRAAVAECLAQLRKHYPEGPPRKAARPN